MLAVESPATLHCARLEAIVREAIIELGVRCSLRSQNSYGDGRACCLPDHAQGAAGGAR
jgi:hypothetical protein